MRTDRLSRNSKCPRPGGPDRRFRALSLYGPFVEALPMQLPGTPVSPQHPTTDCNQTIVYRRSSQRYSPVSGNLWFIRPIRNHLIAIESNDPNLGRVGVNSPILGTAGKRCTAGEPAFGRAPRSLWNAKGQRGPQRLPNSIMLLRDFGRWHAQYYRVK